jgi:MFS family permease
LLTYTLSGVLSDKLGRKPLVILSALAMGIFLVGILLLPSYQLAFVFVLIAGMGNLAMDASSYPGLSEIFPKSVGSANVLVKAFMCLQEQHCYH